MRTVADKGKTAVELIQEQKEKIDKLREKQTKKAKVFNPFLIALIAAVLVSIIAGALSTKTLRNSAHDSLVEAVSSGDKEEASAQFSSKSNLGFEDSSFMYEQMFLGNTNLSLMSQSGKILYDGDNLYQSIEGILQLVKSGEAKTIYESDVSYLNKYGDEILFRDDKTKHLMKYNPNDGSVSTLNDKYSFGETIVDDGTIYFINLSEDKGIFAIDDTGTTVVNKKDHEKFAIVGNYILCLRANGTFHYIDKVSKSSLNQLKDISNFVVYGKVYAQSGDRIFSFTPDFRNSTLECEGMGDLIFVGKNGIYTHDIDTIELIKDGVSKTILDEVSMCKEIYEANESQAIVRKITIDGAVMKEELVAADF